MTTQDRAKSLENIASHLMPAIINKQNLPLTEDQRNALIDNTMRLSSMLSEAIHGFIEDDTD